MEAVIISIGDEVLLGDTVDTNSAWLGRQLSEINIKLVEKVVIGDEQEQIIQAIEQEKKKAKLIIITGGLGPTNDDKTKESLSVYFNTPLVKSERLYSKIESIYTKRGRSNFTITDKMVELPESATIIDNDYGIAPAMWFEVGYNIVIALPGVPFEMKGIMTDQVLPRLTRLTSESNIVHRYFLTSGVGETDLADRLKAIEANLPSDFSIAYLPSFSGVKIRLTGTGNYELAATADKLRNQIAPLLEDVLYSEDRDGSIVQSIAELANKHNLKLAVAESCTGGNIAHQITLVPGSSSYFLGGLVAYDNSIKQTVLGVHQSTLEQYGAVSEQTVREMAQACLRLFNSDYSVAVSGVAGPTGGSNEKPVGTVFIAVANHSQIIAKRFTFVSQREKNIELSTMMAFHLLFRLLKESNA